MIRNIIVTPVVLFIRAPIMLLSYAFRWIANILENVGRAVPGWHHL